MSAEYADVTAKFHELSALPTDTPEYIALREQIVQQCLPLTEHIARRFNNRGQDHDDLVQVARVGLLNAVNRFDVQTGSEFVAFAVPTIMGEVRRHFRDHGWAVKVPRRLKELHLRIGAATAEMSQRLGRAPTASELAAELGEDREEVVQGLIAGSSYTTRSIDAGRDDDDDTQFLAGTLGESDSALDRIEDREALRPGAGQTSRTRTRSAATALLQVHDTNPDRRTCRRIANARLTPAGQKPHHAPARTGRLTRTTVPDE